MIIHKPFAFITAFLVSTTTATPFPIAAGGRHHNSALDDERSHSSSSSSSSSSTSAATAAAHTVVHQFANGTWVENIAVRPNGNLLVTLLSPLPELYEIDPSCAGSASAAARLVHRFDGYAGLLGIAETAPDVFALVAGNSTVLGSHAIWTVDFSSGGGGGGGGGGGDTEAPAVISKAADVPEGLLLNGLTALPGGGGGEVVLVADTFQGNVRRVDLRTAEVRVVLSDAATMAPPPPPNVTAAAALGINGLRYREADGSLYYVNSYKELVSRVPVDAASGEATGAFEVLARGVRGDDFALKEEEGEGKVVAYVAEGWNEDVVRAELWDGGKKEVVVGGLHETTVAGATAAAWGRRRGVDEGVLYVTTCGGQEVPVNGTYTEGGKVVAIDIGGWR